MITSLSETEFIYIYGIDHYMALCSKVYSHMKKYPEYADNMPVMFALMMFEWPDDKILVIEASINKPKEIGGADDFGIVSMRLTDKNVPDEILDRINFVRTAKDNFLEENTDYIRMKK